MVAYLSIAEQDEIRRCLLLYAKLHGIGVPRLSWRIVADNAAKIELPVRTLARFLAGKRVNDAALAACAAFARKIQDPLTPLGETLHRTYGSACDVDISGSYVVLRENIECAITITAEQQFWRMTERDKHSSRIYEGVIIHMSGAFVALLKDRIFGLPRSYHFNDAVNRPFYGSSVAFMCDRDGIDKVIIRRL